MALKMLKRPGFLPALLSPFLLNAMVLLATVVAKEENVTIITIPKNRNWNIGSLTSPEGYFNKNESRIKIYNFVSTDGRKYNLTIMFPEFHWNFKVFLCTKPKICPYDALTLPLSEHKNGRESKNLVARFCDDIPPTRSPVNTFTGDVFLEIFYIPSDKELLPEREHLLSEKRQQEPFYNVTYEMYYTEGEPFQRIQMDYYVLDKNYPCNLNGIPVLHKYNDSFYKYECSCRFSTYGSECEWGAKCPQGNTRSLCSNNGSCKEFANMLLCICDYDFFGTNCLHFSYLNFEKGEACRGCEGESCYLIPNGTPKCACGPGYLLQDGSCVNETADVILNYTLHQKASEKQLEVELTNLLRYGLDKKLELDVKQNSQMKSFTLRGVTMQEARLINDESFLGCLLNRSCSLFPPPKWQKVEGKFIKSLVPSRWLRAKTIQSFKFKMNPKSNNLEVCCSTEEKTVNVTFYKDDHRINQNPVIPHLRRHKELLWSEGHYSISYTNGYRNGFCLRINDPVEEDFGIYECEVEGFNIYEKRRLFTHRNSTGISIELKPKRLTLYRGENISVTCKVKANSSYDASFKFHYDAEPKDAYDSTSIFMLSRSIRVITITNLKLDVKLNCSATEILQKNISGEFAESFIDISILQENTSYCQEEEHLNMTWILTKVETVQKSDCPPGYEGQCERFCTFDGANSKPSWRTPNCLNCLKTSINGFFRKLLIYKRGLRPFNSNPGGMVKDLKDMLLRDSNYLPGEIGNILRQLTPYLQMDQLKPSFDEFWSTIDVLLRADKPFVESDLLTFQNVLSRHPWKAIEATCSAKVIRKENLFAYLQKRLWDMPLSVDITVFPPKNNSWMEDHSLYSSALQGNESIKVKIGEVPEKVSHLVFSLFWKPNSILPFWKISQNEDPDSNWPFSRIASPFAQVDAHTNTSNTFFHSPNMKVSLTFSFCGHNPKTSFDEIRYELSCGQYVPRDNKWHLSNCWLERHANATCTCSCHGVDGWVGLVYNNQIIESIPWSSNIIVAVSCCVSLLILAVTLFSLFWTERKLTSKTVSEVVHVLSNVVLNSVFLYASITDPQKHANNAFFITVSCCFFLSLCVSVSHQVSFLPKYSNGTLPLVTNSPLFVFIFSIVLTAMLGIILWMVQKVESVTLTSFWLPAKRVWSPTVVALSSISLCFLLLAGLALFNLFSLRKARCPSSVPGVRSVFIELRNFCLLFVFDFALVLVSIFRRGALGRYLFILADVPLAVLILYLYGIPFKREGQIFVHSRGEHGREENAKYRLEKYICCPCCNKFLHYILRKGDANNASNDRCDDSQLSETDAACRTNGHEDGNQSKMERSQDSLRNAVDTNSCYDSDRVQDPLYVNLAGVNQDHSAISSHGYRPMKPSMSVFYRRFKPNADETRSSDSSREENQCRSSAGYCVPRPGLLYHEPRSSSSNPNRSLDRMKLDNLNGHMTSDNVSDKHFRRNSTRQTLKSQEIPPLAKSLHSSPMLGPDRQKDFIRNFSHKLSSLTLKMHLGSVMRTNSYGLLDGGSLNEHPRDEAVRVKFSRVHRRQNSL